MKVVRCLRLNASSTANAVDSLAADFVDSSRKRWSELALTVITQRLCPAYGTLRGLFLAVQFSTWIASDNGSYVIYLTRPVPLAL
jgi:hypothetical protein